MRKKQETKDKAWLRLQIRNCIRAWERDEGMPHFYNNDSHEYSRRLTSKETVQRDRRNKPHYYYCKSDRAIATAAEKMYLRFLNRGIKDETDFDIEG